MTGRSALTRLTLRSASALSRAAGEGGPSPQGWEGEGSAASASADRCWRSVPSLSSRRGCSSALAALPIIWWLLRVTPPAPRRIAFPAIRLLLGLVPREETPARTPLWLILLRMALAALVIFAVAHPLLNPQARLASTGPILLVVDDGWAAARDWPARQAAPTICWPRPSAKTGRWCSSRPPRPPPTSRRRRWRRCARRTRAPRSRHCCPNRGRSTGETALARLEALSLPDASSAVWLSDGIADGGGDQALAGYLAGRGSLRYLAAAVRRAPLLLAAGDGSGARSRRRAALVAGTGSRASFRCVRAARTAACSPVRR